MNATLESLPTRADTRTQFSVGHVVWLTLVLAAAVLRLTDLAGLPLSPAEATHALSTYAIWHPATAAAGGSPLAANLTALLTPVLGDGDAVMRLIPALAGLSLVLLPWLWRDWLGQLGALAATSLLALSPIQSVVARTAGGDALALAAGMWLLVAGWRWLDSAESRWFLLSVAALALGLATSPLFYTLLLSLGLGLGLQRLVGPPLMDSRPTISPILRQQALGLGVGLFLVVGAGVLWRPEGLGQAAALLSQWLANFGGANDGLLRVTPLLALGRYEPALLTLGLPAIVWATWRGEARSLFLVYWLAAILAFMFVQKDALTNSALITLPAYLLVGIVISWAAPQLNGRWWWLGALFSLILTGLLWVNLVRYARIGGNQSTALLPIMLTGLLLLISLGVLLLLSLALPGGGILRGALVGWLLFLAYLNWGTGWWLSHQAANDPRERWVLTGTSSELLLFDRTVRQVSYQATGNDRALTILSSVDTPALRWYLRDFEHVTYVAAIPAGANALAIITDAATTPTLEGRYLATRFAWLTAEASPQLPRVADSVEILRWWLFHESPMSVDKTSLTLWLNAARVNR